MVSIRDISTSSELIILIITIKMYSRKQQRLQQPEIDDYLEQDEMVYFYLQNECLFKV